MSGQQWEESRAGATDTVGVEPPPPPPHGDPPPLWLQGVISAAAEHNGENVK